MRKIKNSLLFELLIKSKEFLYLHNYSWWKAYFGSYSLFKKSQNQKKKNEFTLSGDISINGGGSINHLDGRVK